MGLVADSTGMVGASIVAPVATVVVLLAASAFFSSSEIAVFSLPPERVDALAASDDRGPALRALRDDPHRLLVTILVGNNVVNIGLSSILTVLLVAYLPPELAVVGTTVVGTSLVLVCGEILPKSWGLANADSWALTVAHPIRLVALALWPLVAFFDALTRWLAGFVGGSADIERELLEEE